MVLGLTTRRVVGVVGDVPGGTGVVVVSSVLLVEVEGGGVVVGRAVVDGAEVTEDWVASCRFGELSLPVATSKSSATMATEANAYSAAL